MRSDIGPFGLVKMNTKEVKRPIVVDLFAGCGGLSLGFEQAGFDVAAAVEIDPIHASVHEFNFPYSSTICADVRDVTGKDIRNRSDIGTRDIDVVVGGAPCQGFSLIGKRSFDDPRNLLVAHYVRLVGELRPKYCVFENVKGLTVGKHVEFLKDLIAQLSSRGYDVLLPYRVLNAADYGVPQNRERLFLIGVRRGQAMPEYPTPFPNKITIGEAISDLPDAEAFEELENNDSVPVVWKTREVYAATLRGIIDDPSNFGYIRRYPLNVLTASLQTKHTELTRRRFNLALPGQIERHSRFFKLAVTGQSNTLRAGTDSARGAFTSPRPIHPVFSRVITVREAARIHSYPDWFRFHKTKWHGFREIGNSVPPLLARQVAGAILRSMGITPVRPSCILALGSEALLGFDMRRAAAHFSVSRYVIAQRTRKSDKKDELWEEKQCCLLIDMPN